MPRDFVPDSGRIVHMKAPSLSDTVRVDAGFVVGDEVSAHYDPMIAKLIVQGQTRALAIQKLHSALEEFEIAGLITNIEFLKKICKNTVFRTGDVETGFITKQKDDLFAEVRCSPEVYAQAALGSFLVEATALQDTQGLLTVPQSGWGPPAHGRTFKFLLQQDNGNADSTETSVSIRHIDIGLFDIAIDDIVYNSVASEWDPHNRVLTSFFPHTRLETRIIHDKGKITMFQQGQQYKLEHARPKWIGKALGIKDMAHSVLAPMPCKILRVEAKAGGVVQKDQVLVVIESMKMETAIRSPQDGVVARVVHQQGVSDLVEISTSTLTVA